MSPLATEWWLRPVISAARVGEHSAVVWYYIVAYAVVGDALEGGSLDRPTGTACAEPDVVG
jgi:hypothetical protein